MFQSNNKGFVILTSTIVLGMVLLLVSLSAGLVFLFLREGTSDVVVKQRSFFSARACLERALLQLALDPAYGGNEIVLVDGTDQCQIAPIQSVPPNRIITATATENGKTTTLLLTVNDGLDTVSFQEQ